MNQPSITDSPRIIVWSRSGPVEIKAKLVQGAAFPLRMGKPEEYAKLAVSIVENPMLNGLTIRLDAAQRFAPK